MPTARGSPRSAIGTRVIPDERYMALTSLDERLRAITLLWQQASSLEAAVAEREAAQERLRQAEERFRAIAEWMPEKVFTARPDGATEYRNPQWVMFAGPAPAVSVEEWWSTIVHLDEVEETAAR
jgi:PAS domain-containing protein